MKAPISWIRDYVDLNLPVEELVRLLTLTGLEVEEVRYVGLPLPEAQLSGAERRQAKLSGLGWAPDKIVVGAILEVMPHPNADRLTLCRLDDGSEERIVLTGAPNLYDYKGVGPLAQPLKVAYAREGSVLYDGHQPGWQLMTLKKTKIRGVVSDSMVCSEKELGISEEHEGIIILDPDAPVGMPLVDYMGDAVLDIAIIPNMARCASILGIAREIAAITGQALRQPDYHVPMSGAPIQGRVSIRIEKPELNPRFVLGLVEGVTIGDSPYWVQRRLRLAGMRPINNVVDATNYAMLELGEPLHAFDYDALVQRAGGAPTIITRTANPGETLTTLDDVERKLDGFTVLVCDIQGALSIGGVMGGAESEVTPQTRNILLEGAAWNFINIRKTMTSQGMNSEAGYRFSRGVHPAMAERGVRRCLGYLQAWTGGAVAQGLVDEYPLPPEPVRVTVDSADVRRWLGIELSAEQIADHLRKLEFACEVRDGQVQAMMPDHRMDIGEGVIGRADLMEEVARMVGYEHIPEARLADPLPPKIGSPRYPFEERLRDVLAGLGLQETITHRMTSPEREQKAWLPEGNQQLGRYFRIYNPINAERTVLRQSLLPMALETAERNARLNERIALFEVGPVFIEKPGQQLPDEQSRLHILLTGKRAPAGWQDEPGEMDFYDLKGVVEAVLEALHLPAVRFLPATDPSLHPGKTAEVCVGEQRLGVIGELHPLVKRNYDLAEPPVLVAELDARALMELSATRFDMRPVPAYPPVLEDLALVLPEETPAGEVEALIRQTGGAMLRSVRLFDVYRSEQLGAGMKSLAYSLTYQADDRTLTDTEVLKLRQRIIRRLEDVLGAKLRS